MSQNSSNRHKRQRSSAQHQQFHFEDDQHFQSLLPPPTLTEEGSSAQHFPIQHRNDQTIDTSGRYQQRQPQHGLHQHSVFYTGQEFPPPQYLQQQVPQTDFTATTLQFPYLGTFSMPPPDLAGVDSQFLPHTDIAASQTSRPSVLPWNSAPAVFGHNKNVSISTHFDMFSLNEPIPYEQPTAARVGQPQTHVSLLALLPYTSRQFAAPQLRVPSSNFFPPGSGHIGEPHLRIPSLDQSAEQREISFDLGQHDQPILRQFLPKILKIDAFNFNTFLLDILNGIGTLPPLDDFYNLIYNNESYPENVLQQERIDQLGNTDTSGAEVLSQILDIFRDPETLLTYYPNIDLAENKLSSVNIHELLRSFLALKILHDSLILVNDASSDNPATIPRLNIYKVYFILCQKLILMYPIELIRTSLQQKLILGQSKLGKLIKLVYPNLALKRLGRRGASKYNYMGVKWNTGIVSEEILSLCEEDLPKLGDIFKNIKKLIDHLRKRTAPTHLTPNPGNRVLNRRQSTVSTGIQDTPPSKEFSLLKPQVTFLQPRTKYPIQGFSPLALVSDPQVVDPKISWFGAARHHSLLALQDFRIGPNTISDILLNTSHMANDDSWLYNETVRLVDLIVKSELRVEKEYLHLFLVFSVDLLPTMLIYDDLTEKSARDVLLRKNLKFLVAHIALRYSGNSLVDYTDVLAFVGVVKRLIHLSELIESFCLSELDSHLLENMRNDVDRLTSNTEEAEFDDGRIVSPAGVIFAGGILRTLNAYQLLDFAQSGMTSAQKVIDVVKDDAASSQDNLMAAVRRLIEDTAAGIENGPTMSLQDVSTQVSIGLIELVHGDILTEKLSLHYPALVLRDIALYNANRLLTHVYDLRFIGASGALSQTFRFWWLICMFSQEYISLLSELVGLHESLT